MLERIRRRATKIIPELRDFNYEERLKECGLTTLEARGLSRGGTPYTEVYMYVPCKCPCFWPFFSLCPKKFFLFSLCPN